MRGLKAAKQDVLENNTGSTETEYLDQTSKPGPNTTTPCAPSTTPEWVASDHHPARP